MLHSFLASLALLHGLVGLGGHTWQLGRANDLLPCMRGALDCTLRLGQTASWGPKASRSGDWVLWSDGATSKAPQDGLSTQAPKPGGTWLAKIHKFIVVRALSPSLADSYSDSGEAVPKWAFLKVSQNSGHAECPPWILLFHCRLRVRPSAWCCTGLGEGWCSQRETTFLSLQMWIFFRFYGPKVYFSLTHGFWDLHKCVFSLDSC